MKSILQFIIILLPWFISSLIPIDKNFYNSLNLPFFTPPNYLYGIIWTTLYILISISIYQTTKDYKIKDLPKSYKYSLCINYIANQSFQPFFFLLKNTFLSFVSCITTFVTALFLYKETKNIKDSSSKYLIPYIIFSIFATILSLSIYFLNLN